MKISTELSLSIMRSLEDHGIESTRDTFALIFEGLDGDDLVETAGSLHYHGLSRRVISELLGTSTHKTLKLIEESGVEAPDNIVGLDGRPQRHASRPGRPFAARDDLLIRDLEKVVSRLAAFASSGTELSPAAASLVKEVSSHDLP